MLSPQLLMPEHHGAATHQKHHKRPEKDNFHCGKRPSDPLDANRDQGIEQRAENCQRYALLGVCHFDGLKEANPCRFILKRYRELGGEILTTGSDAHKPQDMAFAFDIIVDLLKDCGFSYYTLFHQRKPEFIRL